MIRSTAKAIIFHNGKILLNKCTDGVKTYYDFPGGGQHKFETMEEAVVREVQEETGYKVECVKFAAIAEEIYNNEEIRTKYSNYAHRIMHMFVVKLTDETAEKADEYDLHQIGSVWMTLEEADKLEYVNPIKLRGRISELIDSDNVMYLGCTYLEKEEIQ